jgi:hypothetical protein
MNAIRITTRVLAPLATAALLLAGCSSTTTASSSTAPTVAPPVATSAPATPSAAPSTATTAPVPMGSTDPAPTNCKQFKMTMAHMATYWDYLGLNMGTTNDESLTLANLTNGVAALQKLAPKCAPKAAAAIDTFAATVAATTPIYSTQPVGPDAQKVAYALTDMGKAGAAMFEAMGLATYTWE